MSRTHYRRVLSIAHTSSGSVAANRPDVFTGSDADSPTVDEGPHPTTRQRPRRGAAWEDAAPIFAGGR